MTLTYDPANRLRFSSTLTGRTTYAYDANGNQRRELKPTGDITTFSWTAENQQRSVELPTGEIVTSTWCPVTKAGDEFRVEQDHDGIVTRYIWDRHNVIQERDDASLLEAENTFIPQEYGNLISQRRDSVTSLYHFDALGSALALTDSSQVVTDTAFYKPFGEPWTTAGTTTNPYNWIGQLGYYQDPVTGQLILRRRPYETGQSRFLTADPAEYDANLYRYGFNNPVNVVDPSGLEGADGFSKSDADASLFGAGDVCNAPSGPKFTVTTDFDPKCVTPERMLDLKSRGLAKVKTISTFLGKVQAVIVRTSIGNFVFRHRADYESCWQLAPTRECYELVGIYTSKWMSDDALFQQVLLPAQLNGWSSFAQGLQDLQLSWARLIPGVGTYLSYQDGDVRGAVASLLADIATIATAGLASVGRATLVAKMGDNLADATIVYVNGLNIAADLNAAVDAMQSLQLTLSQDGSKIVAAGQGGEALMRLFGARISLRQVDIHLPKGIFSVGGGAPLPKITPKKGGGPDVARKIFARSVVFTPSTGRTYKVFQRSDINWDQVRTDGARDFVGKTNAEAARTGLRPQLPDGSFATLHHSQQSAKGPWYEVSTRYHNIKNAKKAPLHPWGGEQHPDCPLGRGPGSLREQFQEIESPEYWVWREANR